MRKNKLFLPAIALFFAILACSETGIPSSPTRDPNILFQDDFSSPTSGWYRDRDQDGLSDYEQGSYRIQVLQPNFDFWGNPGLNFTDTRIEVITTKLGGPEANNFGVICRYQNPGQDGRFNFYYFIIGSDGYFGIGKFTNSASSLIGMASLQFTEAIHRGDGAVNLIRVDCVGNMLALYVNDLVLATVQDSSYQAGDVGLIAGTFDQPGTDVLFDNFIVRKP